jgi:hypothetical protein
MAVAMNPAYLLECGRTSLALGKPVDVPALLDALEQSLKDRDYWEHQAEMADMDKGALEDALVDLNAAAKTGDMTALIDLVADAVSLVPPERLSESADEKAGP